MTRLALTDMLHALADDEASEIAHGRIVPRLIEPAAPDTTADTLIALRHAIVAERRLLTDAIALWSTFLASSADATDALDQAAEIAERLDLVRDAALVAESAGTPADIANLNEEIVRYNAAVEALVAELQRQVAATDRVAKSPIMSGR